MFKSIRYTYFRQVHGKFLYNSKFDLTAKSLVTNSVVIMRVHCNYNCEANKEVRCLHIHHGVYFNILISRQKLNNKLQNEGESLESRKKILPVKPVVLDESYKVERLTYRK